MAWLWVLFLFHLSQNLGSGIGNVGSRRDACPYLAAQTRGIGDSELAISGGLSVEGRGRKELWAEGRDINEDSRTLRKPWENGHFHGSKGATRDPGRYMGQRGKHNHSRKLLAEGVERGNKIKHRARLQTGLRAWLQLQWDDKQLHHGKGEEHFEEPWELRSKPNSPGHLWALSYLNPQMVKHGREALYEQLHWDDAQGLTNLTLFDCPQGITAQTMASTTRGHGHDRRGSTHRANKRSSMLEGRMGCKPLEHLIAKATTTYWDEMDEGNRKLIDDWEAEIKQGSEPEEEIDDWRTMVPDPWNTRGRITQFKHTLYLYFLMKRLLGKAMEHISMGMSVTMQGLPSYKKRHGENPLLVAQIGHQDGSN